MGPALPSRLCSELGHPRDEHDRGGGSADQHQAPRGVWLQFLKGVVMRVFAALILFGLLAGCMADRPYRDDISWRVLRDYSHHGHEHWRR